MSPAAIQSMAIIDRSYKISAAWGLLMVLGGLVMYYFAGRYATVHASNSVGDILLNILPVFDVTEIFVYGFIAFCVFVAILLLRDSLRLPFTLKAIGLFTIIRSLFVMLTHLAPSTVSIDYNDIDFILKKIIFDGDLFFSGHAGLPFLMALLYWDNKFLRYFFIIISGIFSIIVLLGHLHYSIDVFAAFFITYSIFRLSCVLFKKDLILFNRAVNRQ